jgi:hypothetical protein
MNDYPPASFRLRLAVQPRLTWRPVVRIRWRWRGSCHGDTVSGWRWFLFGIVPIASKKDR